MMTVAHFYWLVLFMYCCFVLNNYCNLTNLTLYHDVINMLSPESLLAAILVVQWKTSHAFDTANIIIDLALLIALLWGVFNVFYNFSLLWRKKGPKNHYTVIVLYWASINIFLVTLYRNWILFACHVVLGRHS